ncbi:MAG: Verru_Chthon cassette protein A, partial [Verrucomicrobiaceae bacterium]
MNTTTLILTFRRSKSRTAGAALILTLGMLVLLTGLVLAFLMMVRTESGASKAYVGGTDARQLADSALNLVIGQIRDASTQPGLAWTSQPGLIRTFDTSGKAVKNYKLYSADSLVEDGTFNPASGTDLPAATATITQPGLWTDLNSPVVDQTRTDPFDATKKLKVYPIFDGNHMQLINDPVSGTQMGQLSLNKSGTADIEGFKVDQYATRAVTMPVKWLYMLKDGTLAPAQASGAAGDVQVMVPAGKETTAQGEANSVVARVAFWADDETAKVNINTAAEGTFSDTPAALGTAVDHPEAASGGPPAAVDDAMYEWDLAARQGANKEYQRYPGHPATTSLSTIFGSQLMKRSTVNNNRALMAEEIFKLSPRVSGAEYNGAADPSLSLPVKDNSSKSGTARAGGGTGDTAFNPVTPDADRLYASIDDFIYNPNFNASATPPRVKWTLAEPVAGRDTTREMLEMSRFFLTANSKAPEQNMFNLPRVSIWPEQFDSARRTAFDKLFAFCSTVGPKTGTNSLPFYFTRKSAGSSGMLLDATGNPTGIDPAGDLSARNLALMAYLKKLTERAIPGWDASAASSKTFLGKYGADKDQILTEIFDYVRCTNLADQSDTSIDSSYTKSLPRPATGTKTAAFPPDAAHTSTLAEVVPILMPDGTRGIGRTVTVSEIMLVATRLPDANLPVALQGGTNAMIQFAFIPKFFTPMAGYPALAHGTRVAFSNLKATVEVVGTNGVAGTDIFNVGGKPNPQPTYYQTGAVYDSDAWSCDFGGTVGWSVFSNYVVN